MTTSATQTKSYEATFILDTRGSDQDVDAIIERLKAALTAIGGSVTSSENLGRYDFVRITDREHPADFYVRIFFDGPLNAGPLLREKLRLEKSVKRQLVELV